MTDFNNYEKPKQLKDIDNFILSLGFNKNLTYYNNIIHYTYNEWIIMIEHKQHDSVSEDIKFEIFKMGFQNPNLHFKQSNYNNIHEMLFHGYKNDNLEYYNDDFNRFKNKVLHILKDLFKSEVRKIKISNLINQTID